MNPDPSRRVRRRDGRRRVRAAPAGLPGGDGVPPRPRRLSPRAMSAWRRDGLPRGAAAPLRRSTPSRSTTRRSTLLATLRATPGRALCRLASGVGTPMRRATRSSSWASASATASGSARASTRTASPSAGWAALGFGFVELGTVTPRPQAGQPATAPLPPAATTGRSSIGWGSTTPAPMRWRAGSARRGRSCPTASSSASTSAATATATSTTTPRRPARSPTWPTTSPSTSARPNTPGLRDLEDPGRLRELLAMVREAAPARPLVVKLSPDLDPQPPRGHRPAPWPSRARA